MPDYRAFLSNCFTCGIECTDKPDGGWVRDLIRLKLGGYEMEIHQHPSVIDGKFLELKGYFVASTEVVVRNVNPNQTKEVEGMMRDLSELLSFATMSPVRFYQYEYPDGSGLGPRWAVVGTAQWCRPTLEIRDGKAVKNFLEQTWNQYRKLRRKRKLNVVLELVVQADTPPKPTELQLLTIFVTLENLKSTFAKAKRIPYVKSYFRKPSKPGTNPKKAARYNFEELLEVMFREVGMRTGLKRIIKLRNDIIHSAISEIPQSSQDKIYDKCHEIIREYLLRLLGYRGEFMSYSSLKQRRI